MLCVVNIFINIIKEYFCEFNFEIKYWWIKNIIMYKDFDWIWFDVVFIVSCCINIFCCLIIFGWGVCEVKDICKNISNNNIIGILIFDWYVSGCGIVYIVC